MSRRYLVTLYNQAIMGYSVSAPGRTRREAFNRALARAGEEFMRAPLAGFEDKPRDILTTLRCLFYDNLMVPYYRTSPRCYAESPRGCGVEVRRVA